MKIILDGIKPAIWREIRVESDISVEELHETIQKAMGWEDYHPYEFQIGDKTITPEEDGFNMAEIAMHHLHKSPEFIAMVEQQALGKGSHRQNLDRMNKLLENARQKSSDNQINPNARIDKLIDAVGQRFTYLYDFGDRWQHTITVKNIKDKEEGNVYPSCTAGERACPPEDCGGPHGYEELMEIRKNKKHPDYNERVRDWLGDGYDPERFDLEQTDDLLQQRDWPPGSLDDEIEDDFIPLSELTQPDNDKVKIKSLYKREEEYADYLAAIEFTIANHFIENRGLKDADVISAINNIKEHLMEDLDFFDTDLETGILLNLSSALQNKPITRHELMLVLGHVLWAIDNRSWLKDKSAYVSWLANFFKLYNQKEAQEYTAQFTKKAKKLRVPPDKIKAMINPEEDAEIDKFEDELSEADSILFSVPEKKDSTMLSDMDLKSPVY